MKPSGKRRALWLENSRDPDNWFRIPEFGVMPEDVEWRGFQLPIEWIMADNRAGSRPKSVRVIVRTLRQLARQHFHTLKELRACFTELLDLDQAGDTEAVTDRHRVAYVYQLAMWTLEARWNDSDANNAAEAIADASALVIDWTVNKSIAESLKRTATNRENARMPRAKRVDHDTIEHEYRRLIREGFTPGEARGKLVANGLGKQPTIYRITKSIQ